MSATSHPEQWVGLGFVSTIENAPGEILADIEGITAVAAQIAWGLNASKPEIMESYLIDLERNGLTPVGWAWCDAETPYEARSEGLAHAQIAADYGLKHFIANQEESYDAHGDLSSTKYDMPKDYCESFREILPDIEFAITTLNRCGSNHQAMRDAGAVLMPQTFFEEAPGATLDVACQHALDWGWDMRYVRPLVQVYETKGVVPDPNVYLQESYDWGVGVIPYILEQALGGAGRAALTALVPAITRQPIDSGDDFMEKIGDQHGITAFVDWLQAQPGMPERKPNYDPAKPGTWPWPERIERTLNILAKDHDAQA